MILMILMFCISAVQSQNSWDVIYHQTQICAVTGSAVTISCRFSPPIRDRDAVLETLWFLNGRPVGQRSEPDSAGRVQALCGPTACTLRLTDLRESDSGRYRFWFRTDRGSHCGSPGVSLTVTALHVQVMKSENKDVYVSAELSCGSSCSAGLHSFIWIRNGEKIQNENQTVSVPVYSGDTYSCALEGFDEFPSPSVYPPLPPSVSVSPSAEVQEGSSVTLTCSSDANPAASYSWYKEDEEAPRASGQNFIITDVGPEHSGNYSCRAENTRGRQSSTVHLEVKGKFFFLEISVSFSLVMNPKSGKQPAETCPVEVKPAKASWMEDFPVTSLRRD
uniref:Ig-like domain-containing protein n=1 Tax=Poecilia reticulata TaxID=8081 RepID=A0A3P9N637_POERE